MQDLPRYELIFNSEEMEGVYGVSLVENPAIEIDAIRFSKHTTHDCNFSHEDISIELTDQLIGKGEKVDMEQWELIDEKAINSEEDFQMNFASVIIPSEGSSEQDNEVLRVRYEYSPDYASGNSREFCRKMVNAGLSYKKEDLEFSNANPGFGEGGARSYSIFKFKGGVNCKHFWLRKIYLQKNNKKMSVFEALKYIGNLDKETAKKANIGNNPPEVGQVASASNNYWKLSSEQLDVKLSNEEKRILTSPVLLPEQDIYRNFNGEECNVYFTANTIEQLQQNFFKNQYQKNSTLEHNEIIEGVFFFESWIVKNSENDKAKELGFNVPAGTWMMSMKIDSDEIWNDYIKTGKVKGFSIDSRLGVKKQKNKNQRMNLSKVKAEVMKQILLNTDLKEFKIDENLTVFAEVLELDYVVFDGENTPLANTEFVYDGKSIKTGEQGEIVSVEDVAPAEVEAAEEAEAPAADNSAIQAELDEAKKRIEELEIENQALKAELVSVKEEAVALSKQPKVEPINLKNEVDTSKPQSTLDVVRATLKK
ncbi:XkdF-like putative serine protease domain-containing protein [Flavobacterium qiangtangense]|uniref:XkdF-like putative serine protease domain-containing protein n=1 Tax=Flavobacterium qiangtangense TaxID=1442595 RepID=A0ABW1PLS8_9FLAO